MKGSFVKSPAEDLDKRDPGDDVGLRFKYQYCYAAINATLLVTNEEQVSAIICENHEDVLVERPCGTFLAVQVKTRDLSQPPFQANDAQVLKSLERFCRLDGRFPGSFECFEFVTNHAFWEKDDNAKNLPLILAKLRKRGHVKHLRADNPIRQLVNALIDTTGLDKDKIANALLKVKVSSRQGTLQSIFQDLLAAVSECPGLSQQPYVVVAQIAKALQTLTADASAKRLDGPVSERYAAGSDIETVVNDQLLAGKRVDRAAVLKIIKEHVEVEQTFETLNISGLVPPDELPFGTERMVLKMARGAIETVRIQNMQDLVHAFNAMYMRWVRSYGPEVAGQRYEDLLARVNFDCVEAQVAVQEVGKPYGPAMYESLFGRLRVRCQEESESLYGCKPEHLLGAAGVLTENCKAWWSAGFDLGANA